MDTAHADTPSVISAVTISPCTPAYELISSCLAEGSVDDFNTNLSDPVEISNICDDTSFNQALPRIKAIIGSDCLRAGFMVLPGMTGSSAVSSEAPVSSEWDRRPNKCPSQREWIALKSKEKEGQRTEAAILIRMLCIMSLLIAAGKRAIMLVPWPAGSTDTLME